MNLLLFILAVIGLTHIVVNAEISEPVHKWIKPRCPVLARIMDCQQCAGFWCGLILGLLMFGLHPFVVFAAGCAGSFLAQLGYWTLDALEIYVRGRQ